MEYLVFRLYGPMASWGEIAVGETRHTASYPSKSAIVGLLGAALGVKRNNEDIQKRIQQHSSLAIKTYSQGILLRDFHTAQAPIGKKLPHCVTRRDEVLYIKSQEKSESKSNRPNAILSSREYRMDALAVVAVRILPKGPYSLLQIKEHLEKPVFHLYLGRKSCPLSAPLDPQIIAADNFYAALENYKHKTLLPTHNANDDQVSERDQYWLSLKGEHYYWEGEVEDFSCTLDLSRVQTRTRRDQPISRTRWQFSPRQEHYYFSPGGE